MEPDYNLKSGQILQNATTADMAYQLVYPTAHHPGSPITMLQPNQINGQLLRHQSTLSPTSAMLNASSSSSIPPGQPGSSTLELQIDFTRPDSQRTRPLLIDSKRLYVDEHYVSVWSPILRTCCIECPDRELILENVQYEHVLELLQAIHPTYKEIDDQTIHILLPLAFDYQMDGLLHRCECFLIKNKLAFLEKVWLADRYKLNRLLSLLLRELKPNHKLDLSGARYHGLSDRVKVLLLERMHGAAPPEELIEPPVDMEHFLNASDLNFASVRAKTGRSYYVNPYYVAAWSTLFHGRLATFNMTADDIFCPCTHEELKFFLMAIYPPQLRINDDCLSVRARAALMDRFTALTHQFGYNVSQNTHTCQRCKGTLSCSEIQWACPYCKTYSTSTPETKQQQYQQQSQQHLNNKPHQNSSTTNPTQQRAQPIQQHSTINRTPTHR